MGKLTLLADAVMCSVAASPQSEGICFSQPSEYLDTHEEGLSKPQPSTKAVKLPNKFSAKPATTKFRKASTT